jgi:ribosomal protein S18 acetylase RimI-like enzyme
MTDLIIRSCQFDDLPDVYSLMNELAQVASSPVDFNLGHFQKIFSEMEKAPGIYLNQVAVIGEHVVGFISIIFYQSFFHQVGTAQINELIVKEDQRGLGIGRNLIHKAIEAALAREMDEIEVATEQDNLSAISFYRRCGFNQEFVLFGMEFNEQ